MDDIAAVRAPSVHSTRRHRCCPLRQWRKKEQEGPLASYFHFLFRRRDVRPEKLGKGGERACEKRALDAACASWNTNADRRALRGRPWFCLCDARDWDSFFRTTARARRWQSHCCWQDAAVNAGYAHRAAALHLVTLCLRRAAVPLPRATAASGHRRRSGRDGHRVLCAGARVARAIRHGQTAGPIVDLGIKDAKRLWRRDGPRAAVDTLERHFGFSSAPCHYDLIVTGEPWCARQAMIRTGEGWL